MSFSRVYLLAVLSIAGLTAASPPNCTANNCERAFNGNAHTLAAASFCSNFTTATTLTTNGFPSFATPACSLVAQISSVRSCAYPASSLTTPTVSPTPSASSAACLISCSSLISSSIWSSLSSNLSSSLSSSLSSILSSSPSASSSSPSSHLSSSPSSSTPSLLTSSSSKSSITTTPTSLITLSTITAKVSTHKYGPGCAADNCLRAFDGGNGSAFCSLFALGGTSAPALPTYATQCIGSTSARVSSACTCLNYYGNPTSSFSSVSPSTATTLTGSSTSSSKSASISAQTLPILPTGCQSDNCLRAMKRDGVNATPFCSAFTIAVMTNTAALPTYQTQCTTNPILQISSACSCLASATG